MEWGNDIYEHPIHELVELNKDLKLQHVLINMFTGMKFLSFENSYKTFFISIAKLSHL